MSEEDETKIKAAATRHGVQVQASPRAAAGTAAQSGQSKWRWLGVAYRGVGASNGCGWGHVRRPMLFGPVRQLLHRFIV